MIISIKIRLIIILKKKRYLNIHFLLHNLGL